MAGNLASSAFLLSASPTQDASLPRASTPTATASAVGQFLADGFNEIPSTVAFPQDLAQVIRISPPMEDR
ncbi:hypothetical protein HNR46_004141 [Haloferula luteola]|uniref:Uncharacterized protein n=1 Tax=Haloferula luteola TaxID=595692 RepID=A0A840V6I8_9BACT|nr:hypothetical protein [Haloferula luteola]MBB5353877.1 hypothetical protein [Haloferula luteola]